MLITTYKSKLPKALSFPIGAQELSNVLLGVPQYEEITIAFHRSPTNRKSAFSDILRERWAYPILSVYYSQMRLGLSESKEWAERGLYDETWQILVYPVEREKRHTAQRGLRSTGLQQIKEWLAIDRPETWRRGQHRFHVLFDPVEEQVSFGEDAA